MSASVLPAVASVHLHSLKPNSFGVADDLHEMELSRAAVGAALRRAVGIVGLSDKEAAALLGCSPSQFSRWCLGKETLPLHRVYGTKLHGPFAIEQARDAAGCVVETTVTRSAGGIPVVLLPVPAPERSGR